MIINETDCEGTKKVKKDWNEMDEKEFARKYSTTKGIYEQRVENSSDGDPLHNKTWQFMIKALYGIKKLQDILDGKCVN